MSTLQNNGKGPIINPFDKDRIKSIIERNQQKAREMGGEDALVEEIMTKEKEKKKKPQASQVGDLVTSLDGLITLRDGTSPEPEDEHGQAPLAPYNTPAFGPITVGSPTLTPAKLDGAIADKLKKLGQQLTTFELS